MKNAMNTVIATDFSKHSDYAVNLGKQLQEKFGGKATLIHISDVSPVWDWPATDVQAKNLLGQFQEEIKNSLDMKMRDQMNRCDVDFEGVIKFGNSQKELISFIESTNADLLVMGHRGQTGFFGIGSFAGKMIASSPIPVLIAKNSSTIKSITCLLDPAKISKQALNVTNDLVRGFQAKKKYLSFIADLSSGALMNIPFVMPSYEFDEQEKSQIIEKAKSHIISQERTISESEIQIEISKLSAIKALTNALSFSKTDLAIVSRHNRGTLETFFIGSVSMGILNEFEGNILVLPS